MKKVNIIIIILFVILLWISSFQIFLVLITEITGLPDNLSMIDYEKRKILSIIIINIWLFIIISLLILFFNNLFLKKWDNKIIIKKD